MKSYRLLQPLLAAAAFWAAPAAAQDAPTVQPPGLEQDDEPIQVGQDVNRRISIAVPAMPTPGAAATPAGNTEALGRQVAEIVAADLRNSELFAPIGPGQLRPTPFPQVGAPDYPYFSASGAQNLVQGYVQANPDGRLTVGCYLYDVAAQSQLTREGFVVQPARLAPGGASLRRHDLRAPDRRGRLFRHAHRLRLGDRAGAAAGQAARDHGL